MEETISLLPESRYTKFEEDYLSRTYGKITNRPDLAFTELVANSWDSGAEKVRIRIPQPNEVMDVYASIEDDGIGMTEQEFYERWMTLAYDRVKHQGDFATMPPERETQRRRAYGRNGIGRHSMLCFGNKYKVETWKNGIANTFELIQSGGVTALEIVEKKTFPKSGHGTIITARIDKNFPNVSEITKIVSARFMFDPQFCLYINDALVGLEQFSGPIIREEIRVFDDLRITIAALSSKKTARHSQQHGIAFWVNRRLVGEPSWVLNKKNLADGRTTIARQHTIIVQTDDMLTDISEDWTEFKRSDRVQEVYNKVEDFTNRLFKDVNKGKAADIKREIYNKFGHDIKALDYAKRRELVQFVDTLVDELPELSKDYLELSVAKLIYISQSKNKKKLLEKIFALTEDNAEKLDKLLDDWDISDMEYVLDEIDRRLATIQAIERFSAISNMDELHVLHPLVLEAKWLFGPEYDSAFYISNKRLSTILRKHLKRPELIENLATTQKRPDIIILDDGSIIGYATEEFNSETTLQEYNHILIIELKCGGKTITSAEIGQTEEYMNELYYSNAFNSKIRIDAFTVGDAVSNRVGRARTIADSHGNEWGKLVAADYRQLVATAELRLFGLKNQLSERYNNMADTTLIKSALDEQEGQIAIQYVQENNSNKAVI